MQESMFGIVDGDKCLFDGRAFEVAPVAVHHARTAPTLEEQTATAQAVHDLWRERLEG